MRFVHKNNRLMLLIAFVSLLMFAVAPVTAGASDSDGTVTGDKTVSPGVIGCDGTTTVTITLDGETGIAGAPADVMLVLDRSGSMNGTPLTLLKAAASNFVDILDEATDGSLDGAIGNGSRIGVVSFSSSATLNQALTSDAADVKSAINGLAAGGLTAVGDGINLAQAQLATSDPAIMIVFTDGQSNTGANPNAAATNAKNAGTEIYAIGLGNVNVGALNAWASIPVSDYVFVTPSPGDLTAIFEAIGAAIVVPAATGIQVSETVNGHFDILSDTASKGSTAVAGNIVTWTIDELGTETATLTLDLMHDPSESGGTEFINDSITYTDDQGKSVTFPDPTVDVTGCADVLALSPPAETNIVGEDHTVTATVLDDFGNPVAGVTVDFAVTSGPSAVDGEPGDPTPAAGSDVTDANGEATFTYSNAQASADVITATAGTQANVSIELETTAEKTWDPVSVLIDIKPGSFPNSYGADSKGNIPVAVFGSATFDVTGIDDATVTFGDAPDPIGDASIAHKKGHFQDVNGDGYMDKVFHFPFVDTNLDPTDTEGCLGGEIGGFDFAGCDSVNIVPG